MTSPSNSRWHLDDVFIVYSTVHGCNTLPENHVGGQCKDRVALQLSETLYQSHWKMIPDGDSKWALPCDAFRHAADPDLMGYALFGESQTDMCIYHGTPLYGIHRDGGSPLHVGKAMRERWPDRVALSGPVKRAARGRTRSHRVQRVAVVGRNHQGQAHQTRLSTTQ